MKRLGAILSVLGLTAIWTHAATDNVVTGMKDKAISGGIDALTCIVELPMQTVKGYKNGVGFIKNDAASKTVGTVLGVFRGFSHTAARGAWGFTELFGFWSANPESNEGVGIPLDAQYAWEWGTQYSLFKPTLAEGVKPIGRKLVRGLADGVLGIAELPGQTIKGIDDGNVGKGLCKGVWFWFSREVYGMGSIFTCIVANPVDNPGYAFEQKWAWSALVSDAP